MGNSVTGGRVEIKTLDYFDRLPRSARAAIAEARFDWALRGWLRRFEQGQISAKELVREIRKVDREAALKERVKIWGTEYPVFKEGFRA